MFKLSCDSQYYLLVPLGAICVSVWSVTRAVSDHTHLFLEYIQSCEYKFPYYTIALLY